MPDEVVPKESIEPPANGDYGTCDRCGSTEAPIEVRPLLACCPVPLCDICAFFHAIEVETANARSAES